MSESLRKSGTAEQVHAIATMARALEDMSHEPPTEPTAVWAAFQLLQALTDDGFVLAVEVTS